MWFFDWPFGTKNEHLDPDASVTSGGENPAAAASADTRRAGEGRDAGEEGGSWQLGSSVLAARRN